MKNQHTKISSTSLAIRKMQTKSTMNYHYTSMITAKIKHSGNAGKDEKLDLSYTADGNAKWHTNYKNNMAASYRTKFTSPSICLSKHTPAHLSQRSENSYLHKNLYINVHRCFISDSPNLETTKMPIDR